MKIEVEKKHFIIIMATMLILAGTFFVMSYGGTTPSEVGHSAGELEGVCKSDGTDCPLNVDIYKINSACDGGLSLSSQCISRSCTVQDYMTGATLVRYYSCTTSQYEGRCTKWNTGPETCDNELLGQMWINQSA